MKLLIVEDESAPRRGLVKLIGKISPEIQVVGEAADGFEGMQMIADYRPDLVITDIYMPRVTGLEMIENAQKLSPETRYVILSGYADFEYAQRAVKLSCVVDYLLKPVSQQQLADILQLAQKSVGNALSEDVPAELTEEYTPVVAHMIAQIRENYAQKLTLEDFAAQLHVTPEYLGNLFYKNTGQYFSTYLRDVRMKHAQKLLRTTNQKIYEIAYRVGYQDVKYFCRVFKEYSGCSAKLYARGDALQK